MSVICCFVKKQYFTDHSSFKKMLDIGNPDKQAHRSYLCIKISSEGNDYYIPLRNNLGNEVRAFGRIGHSIPSSTRPNAGLDYRYALVINDPMYIEIPAKVKIPNSQYKKIMNDYGLIEAEFKSYLNGFKKIMNSRNRINHTPLYRESSLVNFIEELA